MTATPSPSTIAPIATRNRHRFLGQRPTTLAALDTIPGSNDTTGPLARHTGRHVPAHRLAAQLNVITSEPYRLWVLGEGPKPHVPA